MRRSGVRDAERHWDLSEGAVHRGQGRSAAACVVRDDARTRVSRRWSTAGGCPDGACRLSADVTATLYCCDVCPGSAPPDASADAADRCHGLPAEASSGADAGAASTPPANLVNCAPRLRVRRLSAVRSDDGPPDSSDWSGFLQAAFLAVLEESSDEGLIVFDDADECRMDWAPRGRRCSGWNQPRTWVDRATKSCSSSRRCVRSARRAVHSGGRGRRFTADGAHDHGHRRAYSTAKDGLLPERSHRCRWNDRAGDLRPRRDAPASRRADGPTAPYAPAGADAVRPVDGITEREAGCAKSWSASTAAAPAPGTATRSCGSMWTQWRPSTISGACRWATERCSGSPRASRHASANTTSSLVSTGTSSRSCCRAPTEWLRRRGGGANGRCSGRRAARGGARWSRVTVSVGIALWIPPSAEIGTDILTRAGDALRKAKEMGGGKIAGV